MLGSIENLQVSVAPEILILQTNTANAGLMEDIEKWKTAPHFSTDFDAELLFIVFDGLFRDNFLWNVNYIWEILYRTMSCMVLLCLCMCHVFFLLPIEANEPIHKSKHKMIKISPFRP